MRANQKGFGVIEVAVVVAIVGLIGVVGWLVYDRQADKADTQQSTAQANQQATETPDTQTQKQEKLITLISSEGVNLATTSLPAGWKNTEGCADNDAFILPPEKDSVKCATEDHGFITLSIRSAADSDAPKNCNGAEAKRTENKQYNWFVSYDCELVTIDNKQAVKETSVDNENAEFSGASTTISYTFWLPNDIAVIASFMNTKDRGKPEYTNIFNDFVKTLRFQ